jgi:hypothetical protein
VDKLLVNLARWIHSLLIVQIQICRFVLAVLVLLVLAENPLPVTPVTTLLQFATLILVPASLALTELSAISIQTDPSA